MLRSTLDASVIISTYRRPALLRDTLEALSAMDASDLTWELFVVDNADDEDTRRVAKAYTGKLPLRLSVCTDPGTSSARNSVLDDASGDLIVHTDDDVLPCRDWLKQMVLGRRKYPEDSVYGGDVQPRFMAPIPPAMQSARRCWACLFACSRPTLAEGAHSADDFEPFGPNYAISRDVFDAGLRFNTGLGPQRGDYVMGQESNLLARLWYRGCSRVYLPTSLVYHQVRREQLTLEWALRRFFRHGRGLFHLGAHLDLDAEIVPRAEDDAGREFERACMLRRNEGFAYERSRCAGRAAIVADVLADGIDAPLFISHYVCRAGPASTNATRTRVSASSTVRGAIRWSEHRRQVAWEAHDEDAQVWVSRDGRPEEFVRAGPQGARMLEELKPATLYAFRLYQGRRATRLVNSVAIARP